MKPAGGTVRLLGMMPGKYTAVALNGHSGALVGVSRVAGIIPAARSDRIGQRSAPAQSSR